jgi:hypothetical protein
LHEGDLAVKFLHELTKAAKVIHGSSFDNAPLAARFAPRRNWHRESQRCQRDLRPVFGKFGTFQRIRKI